MVSGGTGNWPGILLADWQRLRLGNSGNSSTSGNTGQRKPGHNMKKRLINVHSNWQLCHAALLLLLAAAWLAFYSPNVGRTHGSSNMLLIAGIGF